MCEELLCLFVCLFVLLNLAPSTTTTTTTTDDDATTTVSNGEVITDQLQHCTSVSDSGTSVRAEVTRHLNLSLCLTAIFPGERRFIVAKADGGGEW